VIDEEQRFGVAHKERLKKLRAHVDVLTLTATPIPRTLHLAHDRAARPVDHRDAAGRSPRGAHRSSRARRRALIKSAIEPSWRAAARCTSSPATSTGRRPAGPARARRRARRPVARGVGQPARDAGAAGAGRRGPRRAPAPRRSRTSWSKFVGGELDVLSRPRSSRAASTSRAPTRCSWPAPTRSACRSSTSCAAGSAARASAPTATCWCRRPSSSPTRRAAGSRCCSASPSWAPASRSPRPTSRSAAAASCSAPGSRARSPRSASITTCACSRTAVAELRGEPIHQAVDPELTVDVPGYIPDDYVPDPAQRLDLYKRLSAIEDEDECRRAARRDRRPVRAAAGRDLLLADLMIVKALARRPRRHRDRADPHPAGDRAGAVDAGRPDQAAQGLAPRPRRPAARPVGRRGRQGAPWTAAARTRLQALGARAT
jgi:transcription-repair coupling factor (superfamily II helicase)